MTYKGYVIATAINPDYSNPRAWVYDRNDWREGKSPIFETTSIDLAVKWIDAKTRVDVKPHMWRGTLNGV